MNLKVQHPPHIRSRESNQTIMVDAIIAMLPLYAMAAYFYGKRALLLGAFCVAVCFACDVLALLLARKVPDVRDQSAVVTGMVIPLLLPASIRFEIVLAAALFAILVAKQPFGGVGQNVFNPAVAGVAFAMLCWPKSTFAYPVPFEPLAVAVGEGTRLVSSPARALMLGGTPTNALLDMLLGNVPGAMGATNILVLITCFLYLAVRRAANFSITLSFLASCAVIAGLFPRAAMSSAVSVCYELMSGMLVIGAVLLLNDPVTSPRRSSTKMIYGAIAGVVCMTFRHIGSFEESILFAILIMNAAVWLMDIWGEQLAHSHRRKHSEDKKTRETQEDVEEDLLGA